MQGSMLDKYAFGSHAIMLVYDVTNGTSFDQLSGIKHNPFNNIFIMFYNIIQCGEFYNGEKIIHYFN